MSYERGEEYCLRTNLISSREGIKKQEENKDSPPVQNKSCLGLSLCLRLDRNDASATTASVITFSECNYAVYQCVKGMIFTHAYVGTRIMYSTTLTDDYITGDAFLTTENLYA